jgi:hypothetical protein
MGDKVPCFEFKPPKPAYVFVKILGCNTMELSQPLLQPHVVSIDSLNKKGNPPKNNGGQK